MFIKENVNPKGKKTDDCVIRALTKATGQDWHKVYFDCCKIGDSLCDMPNSLETIEIYLNRFGFIRKSYKVRRGELRPTVRSFCLDHQKGIYVLRVAHHTVCVIDGKYYDTWDCGECAVYSWFEKSSIGWRDKG